PYGSPILGSRETVAAIGRDALAETWDAAYRPSRCVLVAAGRLEHAALVSEAVRRWPAESERFPEVEVTPPRARPPEAKRLERETAQMHLCLGVPSFPDADPRKPALEVALAALGGGMSSRLFQRVREELGLAYAVYTFHSFYRRGGVAGVYAGTHAATAAQTVQTIEEEWRRLGADGLPEAELEATKSLVKGQRLLALESTTARMYRLAHPVLYDEPYETIDAEFARIDAVGVQEVAALCAHTLAPERWTRVSLGPARPERPQRRAAG
ncbi:MAG: M16 family metallopeptidase, partial [Gemmatimonadota bacterium]